MSFKIPNEIVTDKLFGNTTTDSLSIKSGNSHYRYYHCFLDWSGLSCTALSNPFVPLTNDNTKLVVVSKYFPEWSDKYLLKHNFIPSDVYIKNT